MRECLLAIISPIPKEPQANQRGERQATGDGKAEIEGTGIIHVPAEIFMRG